ncbi:MAG TPA: NAD-dependent epimerase/dehydratase family protein, partial [Chitinivibrionales bacterium]
TFYGATKAASENFLTAQSYQSAMRLTIIRPGYTFGNPVVAGAPMQADGRFAAIVAAAREGRPIALIKNDGTQFMWAGDLALLFARALFNGTNRKTYFGLSSRFVSWEEIAKEAIRQCRSTSKLIVEDRGWSGSGLLWDVSDMTRDFGLAFDCWEKIRKHIAYVLGIQN